ncbi:3795_t:CDS:2, partial [Cetraspora pellucida]
MWFVKENENKTSKGYYFTMCSFCNHYWVTAKPSKLKTHLAYECQKVDSDTRIKVLVLLTNDESDNDTASTSTATSKKRKLEYSINIDSEYENVPTLLNKEAQINKILLKMIVCCNLPFALVEHPFFQEYIKALLRQILDQEDNLTIAFDGWTNLIGQSIYDYCIITEEHKEYLWSSNNYSNIFHHTGEFLDEEIIKVVEDISPEKIAAIKLQTLALHLFAITPHSASCKHFFSVLGWFYNQRHTNLTTEWVETMCKLHTFYITNAKQELSCYAIDLSENLLHNQLIESVITINNETDEITDYNVDNISTEINNETNEIINFDISK